MTQLPQHVCVRLLADVAAELRSAIDCFADRDTLHKIDESIMHARAASDGKLPNAALSERATTATQLSGKVELISRGLFTSDAERQSPLARLTQGQLKLIRDVTDVAVRSLRAATDSESSANEECDEGPSWAYNMSSRLGDASLHGRIQSLIDNAAP